MRPDENWLAFACRYVDHKWDDISAKHRGNIAFTLMMATSSMYTTGRGKHDDALLRAALRKWAFSKTRRRSGKAPIEVENALARVAENTRMVFELADPKIGEEQASPLAATPYSLRHTCVSTWLNATGSETQVAQWAGHSVAVLKRIYAKCIVGGGAAGDAEDLRSAPTWLTPASGLGNVAVFWPWPPTESPCRPPTTTDA